MKWLVSLGLAFAFIVNASAQGLLQKPTYFITTDQTGAQTQIDVNHTSLWVVTTPNADIDIFGGAFPNERRLPNKRGS